jgi:ABC-2 type transport system permease protein
MQAYWTLTRRELAAYFLSLTGYLIISAAVFLMGFSFIVMIVKLQQESTPVPITELFYNTAFFWLILLLAAPVITMRLFALEKFSGTFETLMTAPVSDLQVVLAKFSAAMVFYSIMWLPLLACIFILRHYTSDQNAFDAGAVCSTFLGILLLGGLFISSGCCASAMTRSQVAAAMMSLLFGGSLFILGVLTSQLPEQSSWQAEALAHLSLFDHMRDFARGVVDTRPVVLLVTLTIFFLFLTLRIVESRRWK